VRNYISYFGGDPNKITVAGQSAGAASVSWLLDSPLSEGLMAGAISSSGIDLAGWAIQPYPLLNTQNAAADLNCSLVSSQATLECLRALPPQALMKGLEICPNGAPCFYVRFP